MLYFIFWNNIAVQVNLYVIVSGVKLSWISAERIMLIFMCYLFYYVL